MLAAQRQYVHPGMLIKDKMFFNERGWSLFQQRQIANV